VDSPSSKKAGQAAEKRLMDEDRWDERSAAQIARNEYCVVDENGH
jgi:hypothetical protein